MLIGVKRLLLSPEETGYIQDNAINNNNKKKNLMNKY